MAATKSKITKPYKEKEEEYLLSLVSDISKEYAIVMKELKEINSLPKIKVEKNDHSIQERLPAATWYKDLQTQRSNLRKELITIYRLFNNLYPSDKDDKTDSGFTSWYANWVELRGKDEEAAKDYFNEKIN
jgi:hypothetical protein